MPDDRSRHSDEAVVFSVRLPFGFEVRLTRRKPAPSLWARMADVCGKLSAEDDNMELKVSVSSRFWSESRMQDRHLVRIRHRDIFGPFLPEPDNRWAACPSGSILAIGDDTVKATRIWSADRRDVLTEKQRNRLATLSDWPGFYSLRPYKRREESLSVRKWKVRQREEAKRIRREQFEVFGPFVRDSRRLPRLNCNFRHLLVPLVTAEQLVKYRYPDGPAKEKDPDGT